MQCVDCVREGAKGQREARTAFGGRASGGRPILTQSVMALSAVVFLLQLVPSIGDDLFRAAAFAPAAAVSEPWRFLTSGFLHSTSFFLHIAFNLYALYLVGQYLEPLLGRARYAALYLLSIVGGSTGVYLLADPFGTSWFTGTIGASGGVFGLFGALLVVQRKLRRESRQIVVLLGINFVLGFVIANISWQAHLGGLVTGAAAATVLAHAPKERRTAVQVGGLVAIAALLVVAVAVKHASTPFG